MFFDQLINLCEEKSITPTKFVTEILHLSSSKVTAWKNGSIPKYEILNAIANYFDVSIGTLFDGRCNNIKSLKADEQELLENYRQLTDDDKEELFKRVKELSIQDTSNKEHDIEPVIPHSNVSKINIYEQDLLRSFRELPFGEQMKIIGKVETLAEIFKSEENVG